MFKNLFLVGSVLLLCINGYAQMHDANGESLPAVHLDNTKLNEITKRAQEAEKELRDKLDQRYGPGSYFGMDGAWDREVSQMQELNHCILQHPLLSKGALFACVEPMRQLYERDRKSGESSVPLMASSLTQVSLFTSDLKEISLQSLLSSLTPEFAADASFQQELFSSLQRNTENAENLAYLGLDEWWNTENIDIKEKMHLFVIKMQTFSQHLQEDSKTK